VPSRRTPIPSTAALGVSRHSCGALSVVKGGTRKECLGSAWGDVGSNLSRALGARRARFWPAGMGRSRAIYALEAWLRVRLAREAELATIVGAVGNRKSLQSHTDGLALVYPGKGQPSRRVLAKCLMEMKNRISIPSCVCEISSRKTSRFLGRRWCEQVVWLPIMGGSGCGAAFLFFEVRISLRPISWSSTSGQERIAGCLRPLPRCQFNLVPPKFGVGFISAAKYARI